MTLKPSWRRIKQMLLIILILLVAYELWIAARVAWWINHNPEQTSFMQKHLDASQEKTPSAPLVQRWVAYNRISPYLKRAVITAEDARFMQHGGFDWEGIQAAMEKNLAKGRIVAGGSTISQQLAKNLLLSGSRTPWRKAQEVYITVLLEQLMTKRRIFEIYLNVIEWGDGVYGAEAAALHYYGVSAAALSPEQAARLAAMIPNPRYYEHHRQTRFLAYRSGIILAYMNDAAVP